MDFFCININLDLINLFVLVIHLIQLLQFEKDKTNEHLKNTTTNQFKALSLNTE